MGGADEQRHAPTCVQCGAPAQFSLGLLVSTVGHAKRQQKMTQVVHLCGPCIQAICDVLGGKGLGAIVERLGGAYTRMAGDSGKKNDGISR